MMMSGYPGLSRKRAFLVLAFIKTYATNPGFIVLILSEITRVNPGLVPIVF